MVSSDFRAEARKKLEGKWGKVAVTALAYLVVFFVIGVIQGLLPEQLQSVISLVVTIIEIPLAFGLLISFLKIYKGEETKAFDFWKLGFDNFKRSWAVAWFTFLKLIVPVILMIVGYLIIIGGTIGLAAGSSTGFGALTVIGVIIVIGSYIWLIPRTFTYILSIVIAADNPELSSKECVEKSAELMNGNRWKLFCLQFSFIGWAILAACTLGIGYLWLAPYMQFATFAFYMFLNGKTSTVESKVVEETKDDSDDNGPIENN